MNYHKFAKIYSYSRISRYLKAAKGNKKKAQAMYYVFNGLPAGVGRKKINQKIQLIRKMRNRISHNEPLCFKDKSFDMTYVNDMYIVICDFMSWINPNILIELSKENLDKVKSEILATEAILKR